MVMVVVMIIALFSFFNLSCGGGGGIGNDVLGGCGGVSSLQWLWL